MRRVGDYRANPCGVAACRVRLRSMAGAGSIWALPFETAHFLDGFATPDRKFNFRAELARARPLTATACRYFPDHFDHHRRSDRGPALSAWSRRRRARSSTPASTTRHRAWRARAGRRRGSIPTIWPNWARARATVCGSATRRAAWWSMPGLSTGRRRKTVIVEGIWPNHAFEEGIGINALTSADPGRPNGGAVFHDTAVWVRRA